MKLQKTILILALDWRLIMRAQSLKRGFCKDWKKKMRAQSLKRGFYKDWRQK